VLKVKKPHPATAAERVGVRAPCHPGTRCSLRPGRSRVHPALACRNTATIRPFFAALPVSRLDGFASLAMTPAIVALESPKNSQAKTAFVIPGNWKQES